MVAECAARHAAELCHSAGVRGGEGSLVRAGHHLVGRRLERPRMCSLFSAIDGALLSAGVPPRGLGECNERHSPPRGLGEYTTGGGGRSSGGSSSGGCGEDRNVLGRSSRAHRGAVASLAAVRVPAARRHAQTREDAVCTGRGTTRACDEPVPVGGATRPPGMG